VSAQVLMANRRSRTLVRRLQATAFRLARGYRAISYESATVLAASPLFELPALELCRVYEHLRVPPSTTRPPPEGLSATNVWKEAKLGIWELPADGGGRQAATPLKKKKKKDST
jgi:hypothetical protein